MAKKEERNAISEIDLEHKAVRLYLQKTLRVWLGLKGNQRFDLPEMPVYLKNLFLRTEEYTNNFRDQWGEWEHPYSCNYQAGKLWIPEVNNWIVEIRDKLISEKVELVPLWPNNKKFAVCLTHDLDSVSDQLTTIQDMRQLSIRDLWVEASFLPSNENIELKGSIKRLLKLGLFLKRKHYAYPSTKRTIEKMTEIQKRFGVRSSLFLPIWQTKSVSKYDCNYSPSDNCTFRGKRMCVCEMIKILREEGFDIGIHGSYYSALERNLLKLQKETIEDRLGFEITTTRQHWLNWDIKSTPRLQYEAGILADATIGYNRNIGFRSGVAMPYYLFDLIRKEEIPILEVPFHFSEISLFKNYSLELSKSMAKKVVKELMNRVIDTNGCLSFVLHPIAFVNPAYEEIYSWAIQYCLERDGWVTSLKEIYEWWKKREKILAIFPKSGDPVRMFIGKVKSRTQTLVPGFIICNKTIPAIASAFPVITDPAMVAGPVPP